MAERRLRTMEGRNGGEELVHGDVTEQIIGAAMTVLNELRPGLLEKLYENALVLELIARGLKVEQQKQFCVRYRGHVVGRLVPDLIVEEKVIVDTKVVEAFVESHYAQLLGYLAITQLPVGLLLNFKHYRLQWKRMVR